MRHNLEAYVDDVSRGDFEPVFAEPPTCARCGSTNGQLRGLCLADRCHQSVHSDESKGADQVQFEEEKVLELALRLLAETGIADNLPASMRLIEHIAETAAYRRAQQSGSTKVTELILMSARASEMADDFRQDPGVVEDVKLDG